jgi:hypothetical protein
MGGLIYGPDPNADPTVASWDAFGWTHWADVNLHPYLGPGFGIVGGSVNYAPAPQSPGTGWSLQGSGYLPVFPPPVPGPGGTYGYDFAGGTTFKEFGWGTPGAWSGFVHPLW